MCMRERRHIGACKLQVGQEEVNERCHTYMSIVAEACADGREGHSSRGPAVGGAIQLALLYNVIEVARRSAMSPV